MATYWVRAHVAPLGQVFPWPACAFFTAWAFPAGLSTLEQSRALAAELAALKAAAERKVAQLMAGTSPVGN